jgi:hypothetical protein
LFLLLIDSYTFLINYYLINSTICLLWSSWWVFFFWRNLHDELDELFWYSTFYINSQSTSHYSVYSLYNRWRNCLHLLSQIDFKVTHIFREKNYSADKIRYQHNYNVFNIYLFYFIFTKIHKRVVSLIKQIYWSV